MESSINNTVETSTTKETQMPSKYQQYAAIFLSVLLMYVTFFLILGMASTFLEMIGIPMLLIAAFEFATLIVVYIKIDVLVNWCNTLAAKIANGFIFIGNAVASAKARISSFFGKKEETAEAVVA